MRSRFCNLLAMIAVVLLVSTAAFAQRSPKYSYAAQSKFIPKELGRVYIGMPLCDLAKQIDLTMADIENDRFNEISLQIPFSKGNITDLVVQIAEFPVENRGELLSAAKSKRMGDDGTEYDLDVKRLIIDKIPAKAFVYVFAMSFKPEFDQKAYVTKLYGKGTVRDPKDQYHFSDIEWSKRTSDDLQWLIRSLHEDGARRLMLYGRIKGTEWGLN